MQNFLAGIHPEYANQGLFTRLKVASIELARANKCDLIYSKATSEYSTRANVKLSFHKARTIDYNTYADDKRQRVLLGCQRYIKLVPSLLKTCDHCRLSFIYS